MREEKNRKRARAFEQAMLVYCQRKGINPRDEGLYTILIDMLTDALHFAHLYNQDDLNLIVQSEVAEGHFREETRDETED